VKDVFGACRFGLSGGDFTDGFVCTQAERNGQPGFTTYFFTQLPGYLPASEKSVHATQIQVKFIYAALFIYRNTLGHNVGNYSGVLTVQFVVAAYKHGIRTKLTGHFYRHGTPYTKSPGLITATGYYTPIARAAYNQWYILKSPVAQTLYANEEAIQIHVCNMFFHD
jgi:hypothetical protein